MFWFLDDPENYLTMVNVVTEHSPSGLTMSLDSNKKDGFE